MQRKTEKGYLGRVLSCMRMALFNESIAEMSANLGISPTYLNSIECEIRPCTFKILEGIFCKYVFNPEILKINNPNFSPENVLNCAWNGGLFSTFGVPLTPKMTLDLLLNSVAKSIEKDGVLVEEKESLLDKLKDNARLFDDVPIKFFADANFVDRMQQSAKIGLTKQVESEEISEEFVLQVNSILQKISKKTTASIKKCGECRLQLEKMLNKIEPTTVKVVDYDYSKKGA